MTTLLDTNTSPALAEPVSVADLGIDRGVLLDLVLKTLFYRGRMTRTELADELKLSGAVLQEVMQALTLDALASVLGAAGAGPSGYMYALTQKGLDRADAAFGRSGYVGPAPVRLADYIAQVEAQSIDDAEVRRPAVERALDRLVLGEQTRLRIGRAAASRTSMLVYGASGNGKTTIVRAMGDVVEGTILIPYAIEMVGQIVHVFDPSKHVLAPEEDSGEGEGEASGFLRSRADRRWVRVRRPVVWTGGELTRHSLELMYDDNTKVYEAPLQLKANGGILIIDDFGRQQMPAVQLLNRWIVALEGGVDHLTLHTGQTIEIPFDVLILFSTNLPPERLADEAFLRRIRYKVEVPNPDASEYRAIFRRECERQDVAYSEDALTHLMREWYERHGRELRGCHPRDLIEAIVDGARYEERRPELTPDALDEVCTTYFLRPLHAPG
ncbi:MAG: ATP-binding protein [Dehalococcoidia bacterium]|nr:ATP-binding protein [Dehalococcoidia bacterium]